MPTTLLDIADGVARLTLNRPERHNSLVPSLLDSMNADLDRIAGHREIRAVVLQASGRSFSTGGDVAGFHAVPRGQRRAYAEGLVGSLNRTILALLRLPVPVIGRIQGAVTGGSLGLLLACDLAAITPQAFIQPYYAQVGFSPDGGWTAMLPARIGAQRAREIQLLNQRVSAQEALQLGLVTTCIETDTLDATIEGWLEKLKTMQPASLASTKALLAADCAAGLEAELRSFLELIDSDEAEAGMTRFLNRGI
ncbi:enoyl-CoA hydratase/isomerase family protein [Ferrovibrio terrae]|uniref:Enoyl-CoA hydratase/isomerase family protein n=1 Tax=Ferrovibrio terrae TaxID=2594003 RepID=A0A516H5I2_9PROT|nr:enoyl-CoA hydratase/isomerase family protein [Ferrovibrio terrae]QDO99063.1 enoyl-CoA hydratase/isomerase family protein [Ferrovibrio terrae]